MSDGMTECARDQERAEAYERYLEALTDWLETRTAKNMEVLRKAAETVDEVRGGLFSGPTRLADRLDGTVAPLASGDRGAWGRLLASLDPGDAPWVQPRLRALSPFGDGILMEVDYGYGFVSFKGEFSAGVAARIAAEGGSAYAGEKYLVVLPEDWLEKAEVVPLSPKRKDRAGSEGSRHAS